MLGDIVGVCWQVSVKREKRTLVSDGVEYTALVEVREITLDMPYIDFVWVRRGNDGSFYEDEDSPVSNGINTSEADDIANELREAVAYVRAGKFEFLKPGQLTDQ